MNFILIRIEFSLFGEIVIRATKNDSIGFLVKHLNLCDCGRTQWIRNAKERLHFKRSAKKTDYSTEKEKKRIIFQ